MKPTYRKPEIRKVWANDRPVPTWVAIGWMCLASALLGFLFGAQV